MSDKPPEAPGPGIEEQLQNLFRRVNLGFAGAEPAAAPPAPSKANPRDGRLEAIRRFSLKPREVKDYLDRFVIRQDEAKRALSVAICDHYHHVRRCLSDPTLGDREYGKHNIVLLGPTGVGKTYLMRCIAKLVGVPFVKADATKFSETGYVGHDVEDLVRDLVKAADNDVELAQYGIVYLDEIDKIASQSTGSGRDVSGRGVQTNLLKLMEETDVSLFGQTDILGQMQAIMDMQRGGATGPRTINTRHILFIVSGAFDKLGEQVKRRVASSPIGFASGMGGASDTSEYLRLVETRDLIDYGFEPEFVGRLPVRVVCDPLSVEDLKAIMVRAENSIMLQYRDDFSGYGIELRLKTDAIEEIARLAHRERTGARGLMTVLERTLRSFKFELPSTSVRRLDVDVGIVRAPEVCLSELLSSMADENDRRIEEEAAAWMRAFEERHGLRVRMAGDARAALARACAREGCSVAAFFEKRLHDLEYALQLIVRNTGRNDFRITGKLIENPTEELARRVVRSARGKNSSTTG